MMIDLHPQFIKDANGDKSWVVLSAKEFDALMEELDDIEDARLYEEAKKNDAGEFIPAEDVFRMIEENRAAVNTEALTAMDELKAGKGKTFKTAEELFTSI